MQDAEPSWALKRSPAPQLFPRMNKHVELLAAKAAVLSLPSTVGLSISRWKDSSPGQRTSPLSPHLLPPSIFSRHFDLFIYLFSH